MAYSQETIDQIEVAIDTVRKHLRYASTIQGIGLEALRNAKGCDDYDGMIKAAALMERGATMERDANDRLVDLLHTKPPPLEVAGETLPYAEIAGPYQDIIVGAATEGDSVAEMEQWFALPPQPEYEAITIAIQDPI